MGKIVILDFKKNNLRKINSSLQNINHKNNKRDFVIKNPAGEHAICAGLKEEMSVTIKGHVGYYCGGMNQKANICIEGNTGTGLGENMMSGIIHVKEILLNQQELQLTEEQLLLMVMQVLDVVFP